MSNVIVCQDCASLQVQEGVLQFTVLAFAVLVDLQLAVYKEIAYAQFIRLRCSGSDIRGGSSSATKH
jgi:hypothetical protein